MYYSLVKGIKTPHLRNQLKSHSHCHLSNMIFYSNKYDILFHSHCHLSNPNIGIDEKKNEMSILTLYSLMPCLVYENENESFVSFHISFLI